MKRCTNFLMTEEKVFIKYMEILEKVSNIIKNKFNSELISSKKNKKAEKKKKKNPSKKSHSAFICTSNNDKFNLD